MLKHPFSITMFGDSMYWTDWDRNAIFQANKFTGQNASLVANSSMVITNTLPKHALISDGSGCQKSGSGRVLKFFSGLGRVRVCQKNFRFKSGLSQRR